MGNLPGNAAAEGLELGVKSRRVNRQGARAAGSRRRQLRIGYSASLAGHRPSHPSLEWGVRIRGVAAERVAN